MVLLASLLLATLNRLHIDSSSSLVFSGLLGEMQCQKSAVMDHSGMGINFCLQIKLYKDLTYGLVAKFS